MTIKAQTIGEFLNHVADRTSTPGGGSIAATTGAEAAALMSMVQQFSDISNKATLEALNTFLALADDDIAGFSQVMQAYHAPKEVRKTAIAKASKHAAAAPADMVRTGLSLIDDIESLVTDGNKNLITDTAMAALLLDATLQSGVLNILINLKAIEDPLFLEEMQALIAEAGTARSRLSEIASSIQSSL